MNAQTPDITLKNHVDALDARIERLLALVAHLSAENNAFKERELALQTECEALRVRHDKARAQLEAAITRLRSYQKTPQ